MIKLIIYIFLLPFKILGGIMKIADFPVKLVFNIIFFPFKIILKMLGLYKD